MKTFHPVAGLWLLAVALNLAAGPVRAENANLKEAISAYENFEYEEALRLLGEAAGQPGATPGERARILLYQGLIHFTLGDQALAEREFDSALKLDRRIRPPQDTSPKIISTFEAVLARQPKPKVTGDPIKPPPPKDATRPGIGLEQKPPPREGGRVWTWVALGVGGAALAGGGAFAGLAAKAKGDFDDAEWATRAADLKDTVETRALAANILFGVGGAAVVTGLILFFVEDGGEAEPDRAALTIEPGPLSVQATVRF